MPETELPPGRRWQITINPVAPERFAKAVDQATVVRSGPPVAAPGYTSEDAIEDVEYIDIEQEIADQIETAKAAVKQLAVSGAVGSGKKLTAAIEGWANPGNEPIEDHPKDHVSISVGQV